MINNIIITDKLQRYTVCYSFRYNKQHIQILIYFTLEHIHCGVEYKNKTNNKESIVQW